MGAVWDGFLSVEWGLSGMGFCPLNGVLSVECSLNGACLGWVSVR